jgi:hypothetical protein
MDMLDRLGAVPVTSRQRTELLKAQISADAMRDQVTSSARFGSPMVQIGIGLPGVLQSGQRLLDPAESPEKTVNFLTIRTDTDEGLDGRHDRHLRTVDET